MNPRMLVIGAVVLVLLILGGVFLFFKVAGGQQAPELTPEQIAATTDSDGDTYMDADEMAAGTNPNDPNRYPGSHKIVLMARHDLAANNLLREEMVREEEVPAQGAAPQAAVLASERRRVIGKVVQTDIHEGDYIVEGMVYGGAPQLSYLVPKYKRAITIQYNEQAAVSGLAELGDLVDVIGFFNIRRVEGGELEYAKTMVQNARIIAKGQLFMPRDSADTSPRPPVTGLTVAVYPHEAEELVWMEKYAGGGQLTLSLRAPINDVYARTAGVSERSMFGRALLRDPDRIEIFAGTQGAAVARFDPANKERMDLGVTAR